MYSWYDDTSDWAKPGAYVYDPTSKESRDAEAVRAAAAGPRTYSDKGQPDMQIVDPKKRITSASKNPVVTCPTVITTGSPSFTG